MPERCEKCITLERQLWNVKNDIEEEIRKRESGFRTAEESMKSQQSLAELFTSLTQTQALYDHHRLRSHIRTSPKGR